MAWIAASLGPARYLLFTYEDATGGPSGKGVEVKGETASADEARAAVERPSATVRLSGVRTTPLSPQWIAFLGLPAEPPWMSFFRAPAEGGPWRTDPALAGAFHPEHPDDIEATFILLNEKTIEKMWVRIERPFGAIGYIASLLNTSNVVPALAQGGKVVVRPSRSHPPMLWVPQVAGENLRDWSSVCEGCGFDLLFIRVADLVKMQFPNAPPGAVLQQFTTRCLMCRETMHVKALATP